MKRIIVFTLLVAAFGMYNQTQAQYETVVHAWGFSVGGAHGTNFGPDEWAVEYRGYLQHELIYPMLSGQVGLGYTNLKGTNSYTASTGMADFRLLYTPFSMTNFDPYFYAGFGVTKRFYSNSSSAFLGLVPFGIGVQTRISPSTLLTLSGGYNLSLSDKLDGIARSNTDLNPLTNGKQDGWYGFSIGLAFTLGGGKTAAADTKKNEVAKAEPRRLAEPKIHDTLFVLVKGKTVVLRGVNFEFNKATLTRESERILWRAHRAMVANPEVRVVITGHTDNVGGKEFNQGLSLERAQAVRNWLVEKGIASNRMRTVGKGENEPVASNETEEGRAENRRIEFFVEQ